jgi:hypothetical protein
MWMKKYSDGVHAFTAHWAGCNRCKRYATFAVRPLLCLDRRTVIRVEQKTTTVRCEAVVRQATDSLVAAIARVFRMAIYVQPAEQRANAAVSQGNA